MRCTTITTGPADGRRMKEDMMNRYEMMKWRAKSAIAARKSADGRHAPRKAQDGRCRLMLRAAFPTRRAGSKQ